jgi:hypothetical protein
MSAIETMTGFGGTDFADGWWGYTSKDLRRVFGIGQELAPYSQAYCGNAIGRKVSAKALQKRCRAALQASLKAALSVPASQTYGGACPNDPEPACSDQNTWVHASAISIPAFPFQNRPTFQQVVTLTRHFPR